MSDEVYLSEGSFSTAFDYRVSREERESDTSNLARQCRLPPETEFVEMLGVAYAHLKTGDGGELYVTHLGLPFWEHLLPDNWYAPDWFEAKRERLIGTSTVYRVPTRKVRNLILNLVVKWSRVGEEVPLDTFTIAKFINADFNSPFEEFSLLMELRAGNAGAPDIQILTQRPLAIYVPSERLKLWQTGRSEAKIAAKLAESPGVELDILRQYVLLYGWIKGRDITEVARDWQLEAAEQEKMHARIMSMVMHELELKGYRVADMKPAHIIVRTRPNRGLLRDPNGQLIYGLVDYELLERTPEHEQAVRTANRQHYHQHMARRFEILISKPLPAHLRATNILGVDYVFGHAESTGGSLWVVGKDPDLFNYFLPERWRRTPKRPLSATNRVFHTRTKDNINFVWKVSRIGETPRIKRPTARLAEIQEFGYNSPFEEFASALELTREGIHTVYPRAIYMTGRKTDTIRTFGDSRRYAAFSHILTPDGQPALRKDHDYITIWGFWNGPDEQLAAQDGRFYRGIDAEQACKEQLINEGTLTELQQRVRRRLASKGFEDLNQVPDHLLITFSPDNQLVTDTIGKPDLRLCNFELLRHIPRVDAGAAF